MEKRDIEITAELTRALASILADILPEGGLVRLIVQDSPNPASARAVDAQWRVNWQRRLQFDKVTTWRSAPNYDQPAAQVVEAEPTPVQKIR